MKIPKTTKISKCRLCSDKKLLKIYSFGNMLVSNFVSKKNIYKGIKAPLNLVYCKNCKLLQLQHSAPQEIMYKKFYWYRSGITKTMKNAFQKAEAPKPPPYTRYGTKTRTAPNMPKSYYNSL